MPNYNLIIDSTFQPFSFERYIQPYTIYGEAYNQQENAITELSSKSEEFAALAESERLRNGDDSETYRRYSNYSRDLKEQADALASSGLNIKTRKATLDLKRRYESEIGAIDKAHKAMQAANIYRDTVKGKDDSAIFNVDRYNSLDDFLNGQTADNNYISGKAIQDNIAKQTLMESYNQYNQLIADGHSKRAAAKIVAQGDWIDEDAIVNNIYASSGITTEEAANKVRSYADTGIMQGVGTFSVNADEAILEEEIARIKAYKPDSGRKEDDTPKFDDDSVLIEIYDTFGGAQYEEYDTTSTTTESFPTDNGEDYTETKTTTSRNRNNLSKDRKLANARQDSDMLFALELRRQGLSMQEVKSYYDQYKNNDEYDSFESYIQSIIEE